MKPTLKAINLDKYATSSYVKHKKLGIHLGISKGFIHFAETPLPSTKGLKRLFRSRKAAFAHCQTLT